MKRLRGDGFHLREGIRTPPENDGGFFAESIWNEAPSHATDKRGAMRGSITDGEGQGNSCDGF